jgi:hypothetical protein
MRKTALMMLAAGSIAFASIAAPTKADARCYGCWAGAAIAAGVVGAAIASSAYGYPGYGYGYPAYGYAPAYGYGYGYAPAYYGGYYGGGYYGGYAPYYRPRVYGYPRYYGVRRAAFYRRW